MLKKLRPKLLKLLKYSAPLFLIFSIWYYQCLPEPLFRSPISAVITDREGRLLGAHIADDGQWRFPHNISVPEKFKACITTYEDKRFDEHWGVDPLAVGRAIKQNLNNGRVVSGASTLSMQTIRLSRKGQDRTIFEKILEALMATRMEISFSKKEILAYYASNAPFGGNVVGLDAASWKYYGRNPFDLTWAETATLAVLPNNPSVIHPGRNRDALREKRNRLLTTLFENKVIDSLELHLAKHEPLPQRPLALPSLTPHLMDKVIKEGRYRRSIFQSTINLPTQQQVNQLLNRHVHQLRENGIHNAACLVADIRTGEVIAYTGNAQCFDADEGCRVDLIHAERSSGSILKPFLYASALDEGMILPNSLLADIPTKYGTYSPRNFNLDYDGAVQAQRALSRSLNVPAVRMLEDYGQPKFYDKLKNLGINTLHQPAQHYGLSLILGGAETTLWDLGGIYSSMGRSLLNHSELNGRYEKDCYRPLKLEKLDLANSDKKLQTINTLPLSPGAVWNTLEAMIAVERPEEESHWQEFSSSGKVAWKTGTSFGYRDAWAVGISKKYVVAVWVGNADGEGRPGLTGIRSAAPLLFEVFDYLRADQSWFVQPWSNMAEVETCAISGHLASPFCPEKKKSWVPETGSRSRLCPYHQLLHLDKTERYQVNSACASPNDMVHKSWFILPPAMAWFYKKKHPSYEEPPTFSEECLAVTSANKGNIELIYPKPNTRILIPTELNGEKGKAVFEASHRTNSATIYWHLDGVFLGSTRHIHQMPLAPKGGKHKLVLVDEFGERVSERFVVVD